MTYEELMEFQECEGVIDFPSEIRAPKKSIIKDLVIALREDAGYNYAWQANIAMAFQDAYYWEINENPQGKVLDLHKISNEAAKNFLNLLTSEGS